VLEGGLTRAYVECGLMTSVLPWLLVLENFCFLYPFRRAEDSVLTASTICVRVFHADAGSTVNTTVQTRYIGRVANGSTGDE
jgi:hypothetical protein